METRQSWSYASGNNVYSLFDQSATSINEILNCSLVFQTDYFSQLPGQMWTQPTCCLNASLLLMMFRRSQGMEINGIPVVAWSCLKCQTCWVSIVCLVVFKVEWYIDLFKNCSALVLPVSSSAFSFISFKIRQLNLLHTEHVLLFYDLKDDRLNCMDYF